MCVSALAANIQRHVPAVSASLVLAAGQRKRCCRVRAVARLSGARPPIPAVARSRRLPFADRPRATLPSAPRGADRPDGRGPTGRGRRACGLGTVDGPGGPARRHHDGARRRAPRRVCETGELEAVPGGCQGGLRVAVENGKGSFGFEPQIHQRQALTAAQDPNQRKCALPPSAPESGWAAIGWSSKKNKKKLKT